MGQTIALRGLSCLANAKDDLYLTQGISEATDVFVKWRVAGCLPPHAEIPSVAQFGRKGGLGDRRQTLIVCPTSGLSRM